MSQNEKNSAQSEEAAEAGGLLSEDQLQKEIETQKNDAKTQQQITNSQEEVKNLEEKIENMQIGEQGHSPERSQGTSEEESPNNVKSTQIQSIENAELQETKYYVETSRTNLPFGKTALFPGSIQEIDLSIFLKDDLVEDNGSNPFMLRVIAKCNNAEFNDLDEYVFSVRSNERFEYFEEVRFKIVKRQKAMVKVAVKIPPIKESYLISGVLEIQLQSFQPLFIPICAKCDIPQLICIKDLFKPEEGTQMIKIPAKKSQIRMPPIPFKNLSSFSFTVQVEAITSQNMVNRPYDIITQNFINVQANSQFFVNIQLKENINYKGQVPTKDTIRKILLLKIKNSSVYYNYPMQITVFESSMAGGMS